MLDEDKTIEVKGKVKFQDDVTCER